METRIHASDIRPVVAKATELGGFCWLEFDQGDNTMAICMPERMTAVAVMIAEAFNAHWNDRRADGVSASDAMPGLGDGSPFPVKGIQQVVGGFVEQMSGEPVSALITFPTGSALRTADAIHLATHLAAITDEDAAQAVEMRDLP